MFVAHSMGGLVVKMACILSRQDPSLADIFQRIHAILFLATPHQGAAIAQTLKRLMTIVPGSRPFVDDLIPGSLTLQAINEDFPLISGGLQLLSFFETRPMTLGLNRILIVDKHCAVMNLPNERRQLLDADHRHVAMFSSQQDSCYIAIRNALATLAESERGLVDVKLGQLQLRPREHAQPSAYALDDAPVLANYLKIGDSPEDDIFTQYSKRIPDSCHWLVRKAMYTSWAEGKGSGTLWLQGRPGAGKSVLSGHVVNDLRLCGRDCCHYFFQSGNTNNTSVGTFLRHMAFQMAALHPEIALKIADLSIHDKDPQWEVTEHSVIWRKLIAPILKTKVDKAQFWVIDAVEECHASADVMRYLANVQDRWPVRLFITSRDTEERHLTTTLVDFQRETMTESDNMQDIAAYLSSVRDFLPCVPSVNWTTPAEMADYIKNRSDGCFLWVRLICDELRKISRLKEIENVLENSPKDMDRLYTTILSSMDSAQYGHELARAILLWVAYAFRPLTTSEMREPIEASLDDRIDEDMDRVIGKSCGSLVIVDAQQRVKLLHSTAREFLTRSTIVSSFAFPKAEAHARIATVCLEHLKRRDTPAGSIRRGSTDRASRHLHGVEDSSRFTNYAARFAFQHLAHVSSRDHQIMSVLASFFSSNSILSWIEYIGAHGDIHVLYQAGKALNNLLRRRSRHSPPIGFAQKQCELLDHWGDDLIHLATKFSRWLRNVPQGIKHLIPPFCPTSSAINKQFSSPFRGMSVTGLPYTHWDDCLATIVYPKGTKPNVVDSGPGFFAVGTVSGNVLVYDDSIFQETYSFQHSGPVWRLAFSATTKKLASAGARHVRIWCLERGIEIGSFSITSLCLSLAFIHGDAILIATTTANMMYEWDMVSSSPLGEPIDWTVDFEMEAPELQLRAPTMVAGSEAMDLLAIVYRGQEILLWNHVEDRIYDFYDKKMGSRIVNGAKPRSYIVPTAGTLTLTNLPDMNRMAVTYTDGDLVVFDLETGNQLAILAGANTMRLASTPDGRTLAGVDSHGNLTLFDLETLQVLYKIQFETAGMVKGLAFTSDNLRFIELRGDQCRVWEPSVLLRQDADNEANNDTLSLPFGPKVIEYEAKVGVMITTIHCSSSRNLVFCGREDGSILIYNISGEPQKCLLAERIPGSAVKHIDFDEENHTLVSCDTAGRVRARAIGKNAGSRENPPIWEVRNSLTDIAPSASVERVMVSGKASRLLISSKDKTILWPLPKLGEGVWINQVPSHGGSNWLTHPAKPDVLLCLKDDQCIAHAWEDLATLQIFSIPLPSFDRPGVLYKVVPLPFTTSFAVIIDSGVYDGGEGRSTFVFDCNAHEDVSGSISLNRKLGAASAVVDFIVGAFGTRLVVFTMDHWVATLSLKQNGSNDDLVKHFFVPADWLSLSGPPLMGIGRNGEIVYVKQSELAVIRRGLEVTLEGSSFNPRRAAQRAVEPSRPSLVTESSG